MIIRKQNYGVIIRRIKQLEMQPLEQRVVLEAFNQIVLFNSIHKYEVLAEEPLYLADHFVTRQPSTLDSILDSIPTHTHKSKKNHLPKFKKSKLSPKRADHSVLNQTSCIELPIIAGQRQPLTVRES
jgi:uncharacterized coiled-coil protein SlyX